ncbi:hypothetical protein BELL_0001g00290 [Botrytis elliptica]|uniref:Uncharacterized protein n=1 Tax=Botrytis elliptica TaxID=278938 RepID=A0A4Z1K534_9HELO|nr:hypothetical protein BELL_0001g00290 [Botrytis elliptica]
MIWRNCNDPRRRRPNESQFVFSPLYYLSSELTESSSESTRLQNVHTISVAHLLDPSLVTLSPNPIIPLHPNSLPLQVNYSYHQHSLKTLKLGYRKRAAILSR